MPLPIQPIHGLGMGSIIKSAFKKAAQSIQDTVLDQMRVLNEQGGMLAEPDIRMALNKMGLSESPEFENLVSGIIDQLEAEGIAFGRNTQGMEEAIDTMQQPNEGQVGQPSIPGRGY